MLKNGSVHKVLEWARLTTAQAAAVAEGKPLAEVVTL